MSSTTLFGNFQMKNDEIVGLYSFAVLGAQTAGISGIFLKVSIYPLLTFLNVSCFHYFYLS